MKRQINTFIKDLDSIEFIQPWHRTDFFENLKKCHIEKDESNQILLVCDLNTDDDICIKMNDQKDADEYMRFFLEAKEICKEWKSKKVNSTLHEGAKSLLNTSTTKNILVSFVFLSFEYNYEARKGNTNMQTDRMIFESFCKMQEVLIKYDKRLH